MNIIIFEYIKNGFLKPFFTESFSILKLELEQKLIWKELNFPNQR